MASRTRVTVDTSVLRRKVQRVLSNRTGARRETALALAHAQVEFFVDQGPRDTNRFVNGWIQANNAAGLRRLAEKPLERSRIADKIITFLEEQAEYLRGAIAGTEKTLDAWYTSKGRKEDKWARRKRREVDRLKIRLADTLAGIEAAAERAGVIILDANRALPFAESSFRVRRRKSRVAGRQGSVILARAQLKVFGGTGRVVDLPNSTLVILHNKEPHASIVDRRFSLSTKARSELSRVGGKLYGNAYTNRLLKGTGFQGSRGGSVQGITD